MSDTPSKDSTVSCPTCYGGGRTFDRGWDAECEICFGSGRISKDRLCDSCLGSKLKIVLGKEAACPDCKASGIKRPSTI